MLSPSEYDRLCDSLTTLYGDLDNAIIEDITRRILKTEKVTETAKWQAKQLQESGLLYDDIVSEIASRTDATKILSTTSKNILNMRFRRFSGKLPKNRKMRDFVNQTGQSHDYFRDQNYPKENRRKDLTSAIGNDKMVSSEKNKSFRIPITNKTIENVQLIKPEGFTDENAVALQEAYRKLLKESRKYRLGTVCAMILDLDMEQIGDMIGFAKADTMQAITNFGNNGKVYIMSRTISFDSEEFKNRLMENMSNKKIFK